MDIIISIVECDDGAWSICRNGVVLSAQLRLVPAITLARALARDEHNRSGAGISVTLAGASCEVRLGHYTPEAAAA